jgi:2-keto-4-pentenoate hydratase/2-oxohepta-3-ene-1,7-dioic acid hydratase in catechol pathway
VRYVRYRWNDQAVYGIEEAGTVRPVVDLYERRVREDVPPQAVERVRLLAPCEPTKIVVVGRNYAAHAQESGRDIPTEPMISIKPATAVIGPGDEIVYPKSSTRVDPEAELGIVIGRRAHRVPSDRVGEYVLGYTCFNDVTARDLQRRDTQWTRGKGFDTFAPIGPWIVPGVDPSGREVRCLVNGEVRQRSNTSLMLFSVPVLVSFISHVMTLEPGDVIATGTPEGIAPIEIGDDVTVEVEGIGTLTNRVVAE